MQEGSNNINSGIALKPKRGRPLGATKCRDDRLRDRIRTVATMRDLLLRTTCANNVDQFARWFDQTMSERHPLIEWGTQRSRKWRRNYAGDASLTRESLDFLGELFPDARYYTVAETSIKRLSVTPACATPAKPQNKRRREESLCALELFEQGPSNLWTALWGHESALDRLWELYPPDSEYDGAWGAAADFEEVITDLEMCLYGNYDSGVALTTTDLGRAVVVYRLQEAHSSRYCHGIRAYLCVRLALANHYPWLRAWGIFDDLSCYIVGLEGQRVSEDGGYRRAVQEHYKAYGPFDVGMFVENPFLYLLDWKPFQTSRYTSLASHSVYKFKR
ncbi:hypothetical protein [Ralstonia pseudosolanacearum]|uniref:hypothetical protein n=1 Tax=Ralstonia pseudosolanacearum TaxID=1310165 RepID=UPI002234E407|nr:hypothetical protein [Ralstonia sp. RS647]UZF34541.1 hypothetical protein LGV81_14975 [Ralstonia sp. RS647]